MNPCFDAPEQLQHEAISKDNGAVGLLGFVHYRFQHRPVGAPNLTKLPKWKSSKFTQFTSELSPSRDGVDQGTGKTFVPERTVKNSLLAIIGSEPPSHRIGKVSLHPFRILTCCDRGEQRVSLGVAIGVVYARQEDMG